ncbi:MAG TPA: hypothetical protein DEF43_13415 [Chloroflexus aurantiacus]|nr:MAG: hypothetical protein D6716_07000 [Chloroflexota bacterium]GIV94317.1 MAG: hypothetical protein KatS3mg056_3026 [Chloroflexus sp.]HBW68133.1 hypothetical protein [Chloroflexus aurantiacus]
MLTFYGRMLLIMIGADPIQAPIEQLAIACAYIASAARPYGEGGSRVGASSGADRMFDLMRFLPHQEAAGQIFATLRLQMCSRGM